MGTETYYVNNNVLNIVFATNGHVELKFPLYSGKQWSHETYGGELVDVYYEVIGMNETVTVNNKKVNNAIKIRNRLSNKSEWNVFYLVPGHGASFTFNQNHNVWQTMILF